MTGEGMISDGFSISDARADHWAQAAVVGRAWAAAARRGEEAAHLCEAAGSPAGGHRYAGGIFRIPRVAADAYATAAAAGRRRARVRGVGRPDKRWLASGAYRHDSMMWEPGEDQDISLSEYLPPSLNDREEYRPYFEVLAVAAVDPSHAERNRQELRRLRRDDDPFAYEVLHVDNFEDAVLAALANPDLQAVIIGDGFGFRSRHETQGMRDALARAIPFDHTSLDVRDYGLKLAMTLKAPPGTGSLLPHRTGAGTARCAPRGGGHTAYFLRSSRRCMELHLAVLEGVQRALRNPVLRQSEALQPASPWAPFTRCR